MIKKRPIACGADSLLSAHGNIARIFLPDPQDHIQRIIKETGTFYELDLLEDIYGRVHRGTAIDVGAHIGNHTLWFAMIMGMRVIALEPNPKSFAALTTNCSGRHVARLVTPLNVAAGATKGFVQVFDKVPGNSGMSVCRDALFGDIPRVRIDDLTQDLTDLTLIKIDVEGDEISVLEGAAVTIAAHRPMIYAEAATPEARAALDAYMLALDYNPIGVWGRTPVCGYCPADRLTVRHETISVAIMAHPARAGLIPALLERLDHPAAVVMDHNNDCWETRRRALLAYDPHCDLHLVIQDDAILPPDLMPALNALTKVPSDAPVVLYLGQTKKFIRQIGPLVNEQTSWVVMPKILWGVGLLLSTKDIHAVIEFGDAHPHPDDDARISMYYQSIGRHAWYPLPSLIDHRDIPSLVPNRGSGRHAWKFIGGHDGASALDFDPNGAMVRIHV